MVLTPHVLKNNPSFKWSKVSVHSPNVHSVKLKRIDYQRLYIRADVNPVVGAVKGEFTFV